MNLNYVFFIGFSQLHEFLMWYLKPFYFNYFLPTFRKFCTPDIWRTSWFWPSNVSNVSSAQCCTFSLNLYYFPILQPAPPRRSQTSRKIEMFRLYYQLPLNFSVPREAECKKCDKSLKLSVYASSRNDLSSMSCWYTRSLSETGASTLACLPAFPLHFSGKTNVLHRNPRM
jgi:hypothetical protein